MNKIPWGIIAGVCAMAVFFTTIGVIGAFLVLNSVAGQTNNAATLFDTWYQTLLFVADLIFLLGFVASAAMYAIKARRGGEK